MRGAHGLATFSGCLDEGFGCSLGGETEGLDSPLRRGWERLAADFTRREEGGLVGVSRWGGGFRCARLDWSCEMEPGVALPELDPVPVRNRDIPSTGIEGSAAIVES